MIVGAEFDLFSGVTWRSAYALTDMLDTAGNDVSQLEQPVHSGPDRIISAEQSTKSSAQQDRGLQENQESDAAELNNSKDHGVLPPHLASFATYTHRSDGTAFDGTGERVPLAELFQDQISGEPEQQAFDELLEQACYHPVLRIQLACDGHMRLYLTRFIGVFGRLL